MSKRARKMAEAAVDKVLAAMPVTKAAGGTPDRDLLVSLAYPAAQMACKATKAVKTNDRNITVMKSQSSITDKALEQSRLALERCEAMYASMTARPGVQRSCNANQRDVNLSHFPEVVSENKSNGHHKPAEHYGSVN